MSSLIIPTMRYRDAGAMIDWLCSTFGFQKHMVVDDDTGGIAHAQLTFGNSMIMLGSHRDDDFGKLMQPPSETDSATQSAYVIVDDVDEVCAKARAAGATIVMEPKDEDYGGRAFSCLDPEKQLWNFGTYNPWNDE